MAMHEDRVRAQRGGRRGLGRSAPALDLQALEPWENKPAVQPPGVLLRHRSK